MARKKTSEGNMYASSYIGRGPNRQKWIKKKSVAFDNVCRFDIAAL
jgi:hypothetical protein